MRITSRSNQRIKEIRKLQSAKERRSSGQCLITGPHLVVEALQTKTPIQQLILAPELMAQLPQPVQELLAEAAKGISTLYTTPAVFETLGSRRDMFFGTAAVIEQQWTPLEQLQVHRGDIWVACDSLQYPANAGTILRTMDGAGAAGIMFTGDSTDPYDPAAIRASQGALFSKQHSRIDSKSLGTWIRRHDVHVVGTSPSAAGSYREAAYPRPCLLYMGNEQRGLGPEEMALCHELVRIPMAGRCDSLNVAVAAGLMLYEAFHHNA